jgi:hypothetical protein
MDEPPFSLAFVMVKERFVGPAILFYLASDANKNKRQDHLKQLRCYGFRREQKTCARTFLVGTKEM